MGKNKKIYDLICSLGGNCSASHNLLERGLRHYSLPFDWCYMKNDRPIEYLCEGFQNNFKDFLLKENLVPLTGEEYNNAHTTNAQYKDVLTGYYFVNHFTKDADFDKDYELVSSKLRRRLDRLQEKIKTGQNILFIISTSFEIELSSLKKLSDTMKQLYPDKCIEFYLISFNCNTNEKYTIDDNIYVNKYSRPTNFYDFARTNFEWSFLDDVTVKDSKQSKEKKILFKIKQIKKGIAIYLLPFIFTILRFRFYLFGLRFDFCIGKVRE